MESLDEIIKQSSDVREMKRALSVKMRLQGLETNEIVELLSVSPQYVSKWNLQYAVLGAAGLALGHRGSKSQLTAEQRAEVITWIRSQETLAVAAVRDYVGENYGVSYRSKQSYYDLLVAGGMSYHKSQKQNPKHDQAQVLARRKELKKSWRNTGQK